MDAAGIGPQALEARSGVSRQTIHKLRRAGQTVTQGTIDALAAALQVRAPRIGLVYEDGYAEELRRRARAVMDDMVRALDLADATPPASVDRAGVPGPPPPRETDDARPPLRRPRA